MAAAAVELAPATARRAGARAARARACRRARARRPGSSSRLRRRRPRRRPIAGGVARLSSPATALALAAEAVAHVRPVRQGSRPGTPSRGDLQRLTRPPMLARRVSTLDHLEAELETAQVSAPAPAAPEQQPAAQLASSVGNQAFGQVISRMDAGEGITASGVAHPAVESTIAAARGGGSALDGALAAAVRQRARPLRRRRPRAHGLDGRGAHQRGLGARVRDRQRHLLRPGRVPAGDRVPAVS